MTIIFSKREIRKDKKSFKDLGGNSSWGAALVAFAGITQYQKSQEQFITRKKK